MKFLDVPVTPFRFVIACQRYKGIRHSMDSSYVVESLVPSGFLQCVGLPLVALRRCGLLPENFDLNITRDECFSILRENFYRVPSEMIQSGDLLFLAINDEVDELEHVAVCTGPSRIIHALNDERGVGCVYEQGLCFEIASAYRLNIFRGPNG